MFQKAVIQVSGGSDITVMFNPTEYNLDTGANYSSLNVPGLDGPVTQFISGKEDTLTLQLMFNTYEAPRYNQSTGRMEAVPEDQMEDVSKYTKKIYDLTRIKGVLHHPPVCTFRWGSLSFQGVVSDVKFKYTMFLDSGKAVRATADVTFRSVLDVLFSKKSAPWESPDRTKYKVLDESSSLWQLAYEEYGDAEQWKTIARVNHIQNPLDIRPGMTLILPPIE